MVLGEYAGHCPYPRRPLLLLNILLMETWTDHNRLFSSLQEALLVQLDDSQPMYIRYGHGDNDLPHNRFQ